MDSKVKQDDITESPSGVDSIGKAVIPPIKSAFAVYTNDYDVDTKNNTVIGVVSPSEGKALKKSLEITPRDEYVTFVFNQSAFDNKKIPYGDCPVADVPEEDLYTKFRFFGWKVDLIIKNFPIIAKAEDCGCFNLNVGKIQDEMARSDKTAPDEPQHGVPIHNDFRP